MQQSIDIKKSLTDAFGLDLEDARVLVVGLGETGLSVARFLHKHEINVAVTDSRDRPPMYDELLHEMPEIPLFLGGFGDVAFNASTHLIVSPGVSLDEPQIRLAVNNGVQIMSDIDLFACVSTAPVVAITGSNGKSTVTTMLGKMAREATVNVRIGGNLGTPALDLLDEDVELYVLELSSFQLEGTTKLKADIATVLNVTPDHMDRHSKIDDYAKEKQKVFRGSGVMVLNEDDAIVSRMKQPDRDVITFAINKPAEFHIINKNGDSWLAHDAQCLMKVVDLFVEGQHNTVNALSALALGFAAGLPDEAMCKALREFKGLDHRMQKVAKINGVTWINDSKATNVGACIAALLGFDQKVILIAGGDCKGANMDELAAVIKENVKALVLNGRDAKVIANAVDNSVPIYMAESVKDAVNIAADIAGEGDTVLLSPACASLDQFKNYQERGQKFTEAVMEFAA